MSYSDAIIKKSKKESSVLKKILTALFAGLFAFIAILTISSFIIINISISPEYLFAFVLLASGISAIIGSVFSCMLQTSKLLFFGMLISAILAIFEFLLLLCFNNISLSNHIYLLFPVVILSGFFGCVLGINIKKK